MKVARSMLLIAAVLSMSAAAPVPSPSPTASVATPGPSPTPLPAVLGGVTLGDNSKAVLRRLGLMPRAGAGGEIRIFPSGCGDLEMALAYDDTVHTIIVGGTKDPKSQCADPFGTRVGDPVERLRSLRGNPDESFDESGDLIFRYGSFNGVNWQYKIHDMTVVQIELSDGT